MENAKTNDPIWRPLRAKSFRQLFIGQLLSDLANWLDFIALSALIVYAWNHGSMAVAALSICVGLPYVIVGPLMSVRLSYISGKSLLIGCDLLRFVFVLAMAWAPSLPILLLLVLLKHSMSAVFDPVRQSAVKRIVDRHLLAQASSLSQMSVNLTKVLGPMIGGAITAWLGATVPFIISAILYALSALMLSFIPSWRGQKEQAAKPSSGLRVAWEHVMRRPLLRAVILYAASLFFLIFLYDGLFVLLAKESGMAENLFGLLIGAVGAGSVAGALLAGQWSGWKQRPLTHMTKAGIVTGFLVIAVGISGMGIFQAELALWLPLCAALGFCSAQSAVPFGYVLQIETTDETVGPVFALANAFQTSSMLIAPVIGAMMAAWWSVGSVFLGVGVATTGVAAICLFYSEMKVNKQRLEEKAF
ncbi:MFS transporter [Paenibacillus sp. MCAF9]|uniref:MFS transporter n=1 Tax=Paenibacillus sp. MCAF9 TaxID=3233046 RepID=UPI003F95AC7A